MRKHKDINKVLEKIKQSFIEIEHKSPNDHQRQKPKWVTNDRFDLSQEGVKVNNSSKFSCRKLPYYTKRTCVCNYLELQYNRLQPPRIKAKLRI